MHTSSYKRFKELNTNINKRYMQLIILCFFAYMISYIGRLGYNINIQNFIDSYQISKLEAGYVTSAFFFAYGAGQLVNGILCERMNSVKIVSLSILLSSFISFSLFFIKNITVIAVMWGINGLILSTLWCNLIKLTATISDKKYLDKSITWMALALPIGTLLAYAGSSFLTLINNWNLYFIFSGFILFFGAFFFLFAGIKVEKDIKFLSNNNYEKIIETDTSKTDTRASLLKFLAISIIPIFLISVLSSIIKDGVQTWMPTYLKENFALPTYFSILLTLILPLFGLMAVIYAKWIMRKVKNVFITILIILLIASFLIVLFMLFGSINVVIPIILFAFLNLSMHASNAALTAIFPIYYKEKIKSGPTAGIFNCFAYVGSAISTFSLGGIVDSSGWKAFSVTLCICAFTSVIFSLWAYFSMKRNG